MVDRLSKEQRSANMAAVPSKNTKAEITVRRALHAAGFRFRLHVDLPGHPDIVLPKHKAVIFVHGCFWHGHNCTRGTLPQSNTDFWAAKIVRNKARDRKAIAALRHGGWCVLTIWTCALDAGIRKTLTRLDD